MRENHKYGVEANTYHTDNAIFNAENFMQELLKSDQNIDFSGTATTHQNWVTERGIKIAVNMESEMMLNAELSWPKVTINPELCPVAMDNSVRIYNWTQNPHTWLAPIFCMLQVTRPGINVILMKYKYCLRN